MSDDIRIPSPSAFLSSPPADPPPQSSTSAGASKKRQQRRTPSQSSKPAEEPSSAAKKSKSRNGCITCKNKRLKCDETKPTCVQCHRRGVECGGYKKDFKWRSFEEQTFGQRSSAPKASKKAESSSEPKGKTVSEAATSPSKSTTHSTPRGQIHEPRSDSSAQPEADIRDELPPSVIGPDPNSFQYVSNEVHPSIVVHPQDFVLRGGSTDAYNLDNDPSHQQYAGQPVLPLQVPNTNGSVGASSIPYDATDLEDDNIEEIPRDFNSNDQWYFEMGMDTTSTAALPGCGMKEEPFALYQQPTLSVGSPEMIVMKFESKTSCILSVRDGPNENPWRTLLWPLAKDSPALYHALLSMTSFHAARQIPELRVHGLRHLSKSINALRTDFLNIKTEAALATTIALAFGESWDNQIKTGIHHVKGAKALMNRALVECRHKRIQGQELARLKFLCKAWIYMDVITRLTCVDDDESNDAEDIAHMVSGPLQEETEVDPLLGCASTLFPIIGRVANLVRRVCRTATNSPTMIEQAVKLKFALENWQPPPYFEPPEDQTTSLEHSLQTAEAYRWSTLLYLHQAVPEISMLSSSELAQRALVCLACTPLSARTITVQFFPLFAAGCEALEPEDRKWVADRWNGMSERLTIGNVDRCADVVKEVWRRRDEYRLQQVPIPAVPMVSPQSKPGPGGLGSLSWSNSFDQTLFDSMADLQNSGDIGRDSHPSLPGMDPEYTVRGSLHWVSVMREWNWEVLVG